MGSLELSRRRTCPTSTAVLTRGVLRGHHHQPCAGCVCVCVRAWRQGGSPSISPDDAAALRAGMRAEHDGWMLRVREQLDQQLSTLRRCEGPAADHGCGCGWG
jgi:hypothetical protein